MKVKKFQVLVEDLENLTPRQRKFLEAHLDKIGQTQLVNTLIESRVSATPICLKCGHGQVAHWGLASGLQRYRCTTCKITFNTLTGTPLSRLCHKDKWLEYAQQMTEGKIVRNSAKACDVHRNTSFLWCHRFLALPNEHKATNLVGIAEADETYFLKLFKGKKQGMTRTPRKCGGKASKHGLSDEQVPVLICRDRTGSTADFVLEKADIANDAVLCTVSSKALGTAAREMGIVHRSINLAASVRVISKVYHVQNVNAYDSRLKEWMRRFHGVAMRYLANYLGWKRIINQARDSLAHHDIVLAQH